MITILDKTYCCGCGACDQICPKQCIILQTDKEGFIYPVVNKDACVNCGLCEKVCPELTDSNKRYPLKVVASINSNEQIRKNSSSGGIFSLLAEWIISQGGVVFGAKFNEKWEVVHDYTETIDGLSLFRGSKYVQSIIGDNYRKAELFLKAGRKVLFSGTPCQIMGLKGYLRTDYDNLLKIDFVCHGVPSPKVWQIYLNEAKEKFAHRSVDGKNSVLSPKFMSFITGINFRDKLSGWKKYSFSLSFANASAAGEENAVFHSDKFYENLYMQAFLADLTLRPSCYNCPAKAGKSGSDITIGDFWGIEHIVPEIDDDKGVSLVMIHNLKYENVFSSAQLLDAQYEDAVRYNPSIEKSVGEPIYRGLFFKTLLKRKRFDAAYNTTISKKFLKRVRRIIYRKLGI